MQCNNCGATMAPMANGSYFHCEYCGNVVVVGESRDGVKVIGDRTDRSCPICQELLVTALLDKLPALVCGNCTGILMRMSDFGDMIERRHVQRRRGCPPPLPEMPDHRQRRLPCPRCHLAMERHPFFGTPARVMVDTCERCYFIWLERGALARIGRPPEEAPPQESVAKATSGG